MHLGVMFHIDSEKIFIEKSKLKYAFRVEAAKHFKGLKEIIKTLERIKNEIK